MPPLKRKRNACTNSADKPAKKKVSSKKMKISVSINALKIVWQWERNGNEWEMVPNASSELINKSLKAKKKKKVAVEENGEEHVYDLQKLVRTCRTTDSEWKIRCGVKLNTEDDVGYVWNSTGDDGTILCYKPHQLLKIECAYRNKESPLELKLGSRNYMLDFKKWKQKAVTIKENFKITRTEFEIKEPELGTQMCVKDGDSDDSDVKVIESDEDEVQEKFRSTPLKKKVPVDIECVEKIKTAHVYYDGRVAWDATLNQTNLQLNNNKFYIIQLLEGNEDKTYSVYFRWGRVGNRGQRKLTDLGYDLKKACELFEDKFYDKTGNQWTSKYNFEKQDGLYDLIQTYYSPIDSVDEPEDDAIRKVSPLKSKLDKRIKDLMEMLFDVKAMEEAVIKMKYDAKRAPLGKLTVEQIKAGYSSLKEIETLLGNNDKGRNLSDACSKFYTQIPHSFGMKRPPLIATLDDLRQEILLLEALGDIHAALKTLNKRSDIFQHPIDQHYFSLKCELTPLENNHPEYKRVEQYLHNSHTTIHKQYTLHLEEVFICKKHLEEQKFLDFGNRMLLWHGSRMTNWAGILSKGLRVAPPEAPVSGYMFGKGVYFADRSSKSANYCFANNSMNVGLLLLCEVALGDCAELIHSDYFAAKLPEGKKSIKGKGKFIPDPNKTEVLDDGVMVPLGKAIVSTAEKYSLNFNEYVVYNVDQIRMRYLVKVRFNFLGQQ